MARKPTCLSAETPYVREPGYAERYRDRRFRTGSGNRTHEREVRALRDLLSRCAVGANGRWLDAPCGAGRLSSCLDGTPWLVDRDLSMVRAAPAERFRVCASLHRLPFADAVFDGALCMRLFQHIPDGAERRHILNELRRVTRGPVIVSFFHSFSLAQLRRRVRRLLGGRRSGRGATTWRTFRADAEAAGFVALRTRPLARFFSEQWLVLLGPAVSA